MVGRRASAGNAAALTITSTALVGSCVSAAILRAIRPRQDAWCGSCASKGFGMTQRTQLIPRAFSGPLMRPLNLAVPSDRPPHLRPGQRPMSEIRRWSVLTVGGRLKSTLSVSWRRRPGGRRRNGFWRSMRFLQRRSERRNLGGLTLRIGIRSFSRFVLSNSSNMKGA